jgi:transposase-like protein
MIRNAKDLERIDYEIRNRTSVNVFPFEAFCFRSVSTLHMEKSGEWQIGKHFYADEPFELLKDCQYL